MFDFDLATTVLEVFLGVIGNENISIALSLFTKLMAIEICFFGIAMAFGRVECSAIFYKSLMIAGYMYFIQNYWVIVNAFFDFFSSTGIAIGESSLSLSSDFLMDPSSIMEIGWKTAINVWALDNPLDFFTNGFDNWMRLINSLILLLAFFVIMVMSVVRVLEFYIISTMSLILFPFGIIGFFNYLGSKCIGGLFKLGIKIMAFSFVCSLSLATFRIHVAPVLAGDPSLKDCISCTLVSVMICYLVWKIPEVAAGLISGSPDFGGQNTLKSAGSKIAAAASKGVSSIINKLKK